jgi:hypothetical protein
MDRGDTYIIKFKDPEGNWILPGSALVPPPIATGDTKVFIWEGPFQEAEKARKAQADFREKFPGRACHVFRLSVNAKGETEETDLDRES